MNLDSIILMGFVIGTSVILILVMFILWRYIRALTLKTRMEDRDVESRMVGVQVLQSPVKLQESVMMLAEEGLYPACVTSTPHVDRSHSLTSESSDSSSDVSSSDTKSVRTLCQSQMFGSTYIIDKAEEITTPSTCDLTKVEGSQQHQTFTVCNLDQRLEEVLQNESTVLLENEKEEKEATIIIINEEEENTLDEENNNCEESSFLKEKYLMQQTISDSMVNITFG